MTKFMKALVKYDSGKGNMELRSVPIPEPGPDEVLIKVGFCGICGTDLKIYDGEFSCNPPVITGHEFSGHISKTGHAVTGWYAGDEVIAEQHTRACGICGYCLTGKRHLCVKKRAPGYGIDGAFSEYICMPVSLLHRIRKNISLQEAAVIEPMAVAARGILYKTKILPEDFVVILGCGPIALLALQIVIAQGAASTVITGLDADAKHKFTIAQGYGAARTINVQREDPIKIVNSMTNGQGADVVIDLSGSPEAILQGLDMLKKDGRFCALGLTSSDICIPWMKMAMKAIRFDFSYSSDYMSWENCLSMVSRGKINLKDFTREIYPIENWQEAFDKARSGDALKVLIKP